MFYGPIRYPVAGEPDKPFIEPSVAYFAAMAVQPSDARKVLINDLLFGLRQAGVLQNLDWLSLLASHDAQAARLNAINPAQAFSLVNTPTFTTDRGYTGIIASSSYLNSGWDPTSNPGNYTLNSASLGAWVNGGNTGNTGNMIGGRNNATQSGGRINARNGAGNIVVGTNSSPFVVVATATGAGFTAWDRSASNAAKIFKNGAQVGASALASEQLPDWDFYAGAYNDTGGITPTISEVRLALVCWGGHLTDAQHAALHSLTNTYLTAIGAA